MVKKHQWQHSIADAYATKYGAVAQDFLKLVAIPSLDALDARSQQFRESDEGPGATFQLFDHADLIRKTSMAFCLSIQSIWEKQFRRYLSMCPNALHVEGVTLAKLHQALWGDGADQLGGLFYRIRGLNVRDFDSYDTLNKLQLLGNACRHGEGSSAKKLQKQYPELWPEQLLTPSPEGMQIPVRSVDQIDIGRELLTAFANAIDVFWMDLEHEGLSILSAADSNVLQRMAQLRLARMHKLLTFKPGTDLGTALDI